MVLATETRGLAVAMQGSLEQIARKKHAQPTVVVKVPATARLASVHAILVSLERPVTRCSVLQIVMGKVHVIMRQASANVHQGSLERSAKAGAVPSLTVVVKANVTTHPGSASAIIHGQVLLVSRNVALAKREAVGKMGFAMAKQELASAMLLSLAPLAMSKNVLLRPTQKLLTWEVASVTRC